MTKITIEFAAGEDIEQGDLVMISPKDGCVYKTEQKAQGEKICNCPPNDQQSRKVWNCPEHGFCIS